MFEPNQIICGAMPGATKVLPDESVNCSISSPPYWALRDYGSDPQIWGGDENCEHNFTSSIVKKQTGGLTEKQTTNKGSYFESSSQFCSICGAWRGCLGLEPTFELYIKHLCDIYDEVKRVLRTDGCCFVNLGDTYAGSGGAGGDYNEGGLREGQPKYRQPRVSKQELAADKQRAKDKNYPTQAFAGYPGWDRNNIKPNNVPTKSLCCIPQRFAIEMINRGWILRNTIIWHKPNPMPSSAKDRFTVDFEYVFFFVKQQRYWFEPQYEPHTRDWTGCGGNLAGKGVHKLNDGFKDIGNRNDLTPNPLGRNKRTVWTIPTQSFAEAHFATFPEKLVEPMILSGCPEFVCKKCGMGRRKVYSEATDGAIGNAWLDHSKDAEQGNMKTTSSKGYERGIFKGYTDCGCGKGWRPGVVLDPFAGRAPLARWLPRTDETGLGLN